MAKPLSTPGRRVRNQADAHELLEAIRVSGLTVKAWCTENGVSPGSVYAWRAKLSRVRQSRRRPSSAAPAPAEVQLAEIKLQPVAAPSRYEVELPNRVRIHIDDGFHTETLERLLTLVARC